MRYTHDFNFVFTVQSDFLNPDFISPEIIVDRFLETVRNMDRQEIFERSECFNSFKEETMTMEKVDSEDGEGNFLVINIPTSILQEKKNDQSRR